MNNKAKSKTFDEYLADGLGLHMILIWGRVALVQGIPIVYAYNSIYMIICTFLLVLYYFFVFLTQNKKIPKVNQGSVLVAVFVFITLMYTVIIWPENIQFMDPVEYTFFYEIVPFSILALITNIDYIYNPMLKSMKILLVLCVISSIGIIMNGHITVSTWSSYSMPLSYATLYPVMWFINDFFHERKFSTLIFIFVGVMILVLFGSRNPLLSVVSFLIVQIVKKNENKYLRSLIVTSSVIVLIFYKKLLIILNDLINNVGIKSRTINLFVNNQYFADNRVSIHHNIFQILNQHPFGVGIAGDVAQIQEFAHGLYVSILCTYGYIIGTMVIVAIIIILIESYKKSFGKNRDILTIYIFSVIPRGFTGGDIWSSDVFWWMLGIALSILYMKKNEKIIYKQDKNYVII